MDSVQYIKDSNGLLHIYYVCDATMLYIFFFMLPLSNCHKSRQRCFLDLQACYSTHIGLRWFTLWTDMLSVFVKVKRNIHIYINTGAPFMPSNSWITPPTWRFIIVFLRLLYLSPTQSLSQCARCVDVGDSTSLFVHGVVALRKCECFGTSCVYVPVNISYPKR